jgi:hypothetical protein
MLNAVELPCGAGWYLDRYALVVSCLSRMKGGVEGINDTGAPPGGCLVSPWLLLRVHAMGPSRACH